MVKIYLTKGDKSLSHEFLFDLLKTEYNFEADPSLLKKTEHGKLYIENCPVKFNITHSKDNIAIAFSQDEVGIDAEVIKTEFKARAVFGVLPKNAEDFAILWTKAEAIVKLNASSILLDLRKIDLSSAPTYDGKPVSVNLYTFKEDNLVISVATSDDGYEFVLKEF